MPRNEARLASNEQAFRFKKNVPKQLKQEEVVEEEVVEEEVAEEEQEEKEEEIVVAY